MSMFQQKNVPRQSHLHFSAVTLLPFLHVTVATFLPPVEHFHLWHVVQAHANAFLEAGRQVLFAAAAENGGERIPARKRKKTQNKQEDDQFN